MLTIIILTAAQEKSVSNIADRQKASCAFVHAIPFAGTLSLKCPI